MNDKFDLYKLLKRKPSGPVQVAPPNVPPVLVPGIDATRIEIYGVTVVPRPVPSGYGVELEVTLRVPDRETGIPTNVVSSAHLSYDTLADSQERGRLPELIHHFVTELIVEAVKHECIEMVRVDGLAWKDPHVPVKATAPNMPRWEAAINEATCTCGSGRGCLIH